MSLNCCFFLPLKINIRLFYYLTVFQISEQNNASGILQRHNGSGKFQHGSSKFQDVPEEYSYFNLNAEESLHQNIQNTSTDKASTGSLNAHNQPTDFNTQSFSKIGRPSSGHRHNIPKSPPSRHEEPINGVNAPDQYDVTTMIRVMKQQLRVLEKGEAWVYDKMNEDDMMEEWKKVALVFDRFFLILFSIIMLATSLVISFKLYSQT